jgi:HEAT repeat protein
MTGAKRRLALYLSLGLGAAALAIAVVALERPLREEYHLRRLRSGDERAAIGAARALGEMKSTKAIAPLIELLQRGLDSDVDRIDSFMVRDAAFEALKEIGLPALEAVLETVAGEDSILSYLAAKLLGRFGVSAASTVRSVLRDSAMDRRQRIVRILADHEAAAAWAIPDLIAILNDPADSSAVEDALATIGAPALPALVGTLERGTDKARIRVLDALIRMDGLTSEARLAVQKLLLAEEPTIRSRVIGLLEDSLEGDLRPDEILVSAHLQAIERPERELRSIAARCLGRSKDDSMVPLLLGLMSGDPSLDVRLACMDAVARIAPADAAFHRGVFAMANEFPEPIHGAAVRTLSSLGERIVDALLEELGSGDEGREATAMEVLGLLDPATQEGALPLVKRRFEESAGRSRKACIEALALLVQRLTPAGEPVMAVLEARSLVAALGDPEAEVRAWSVRALSQLADDAAVPALSKALADPDAEVRAAAAESLGDLGPTALAAAPALEIALGDADPSARFAAAAALARLRGAEAARAVPVLVEGLASESILIRRRAAEALGAIGPPAAAAREALERASVDQYVHVRRAARAALEKIATGDGSGASGGGGE